MAHQKHNQSHLSTRVIHAGQAPDPLTGAVIAPVYTATTFVQKGIGKDSGYKYTRVGNPTRHTLEACLADIEGSASAFAFPSGLSAAATLLETLDAGSHIVAHVDLYGGIIRLLSNVRSRSAGHEVTFVDFSDPAAVRAAITTKTRMLWFETPSNPLMKIVDLVAISKIGRAAGVVTVCDSTFTSPCGQLPIAFGIDVVVHSATKFLSGHSDLLAGVVAVSPTAQSWVAERVKYLQNAVGAVLSPTDCALLLRSIKTLHVRVERQTQSAARIATHLDTRRNQLGISDVLYPGLQGHPGHAIAKAQMQNFGALISLKLTGSNARVERMLLGTQLFAFAVSLGGVESLIQHPTSLTHASIPKDHRTSTGLGDDLVRLSVGLEHVEDLIEDLETALKA